MMVSFGAPDIRHSDVPETGLPEKGTGRAR